MCYSTARRMLQLCALAAISCSLYAVDGVVLIDQSHALAGGITPAGGVYVNGANPVTGCELAFGGVGISGYGREGGEEGLFEFLRTKAVGIA